MAGNEKQATYLLLVHPPPLRGGSIPEQGQRQLIESSALERLGTAEDIASAVLFLASEHASWITGQILR